MFIKTKKHHILDLFVSTIISTIKEKTSVKGLHVLNIFANRNFGVLEVEQK